MSDRPVVLIVDDHPENLLALEAVLETVDVDIVRANSGEDALRRLLTDEVAVIILDVQMPGLDGFETAAHIKRREKTKRIPIIFLTAISTEMTHALRGYATGAVDYLAKPFEPEVLQAKVSVFVELYRHARVIEEQRELLAKQLEELTHTQEILARQTVELERSNAELERFATVVADDLSEPMYLVAGFLDLLRGNHAESLDESGQLMMQKADEGAQKLFERVDELLLYAKAPLEVHHAEPVKLTDVVDGVLRTLAGRISVSGVTVTTDPLPHVLGDPWQLARLFTHVVGRSIDQPGTSEVHIAVSRSDDRWTLAVHDDGENVSEADLPNLLSLMAARDATPDDRPRLDLPIARRIVERHGGSMAVQSMPGRGTTITFTLPAAGT